MANTPYPESYYAASANAVPPRPALQDDVETDVCVIGAGYTGLSSALFLLENGFKVTVLEAAKVGFGAFSTILLLKTPEYPKAYSYFSPTGYRKSLVACWEFK